MTRAQLVSIGAAIALGAVGCGDNHTKRCDPGTTMDVDGVCIGAGSCSDGTILVGDHCEIDPSACQDGTVLVGGECLDPGHVTADIEEAAEPNGVGLLGEASNAAAGTITIKPEGEHVVVHGTIVPFQDADNDGQQDGDIDTYLVNVAGPVMLNVSADGMHGLAGGFVAVAAVYDGPLLDWTRFGVNPTGDTSTRKLYLPAAGRYLLAIADTRTLFLAGAAPHAAEGSPDFEYYVTIEQVSAAPTALTATDGVATSAGTIDPGDVKLFKVEMGEGINTAELSVAIDQVQETLLVSNTHGGTSTVEASADGDAGDGATALASVLGVRTGDSQIVAIDSVFDYANTPYDYTLNVNVGTAGALATDGSDVAQPADDIDYTVFYYDVPADQRLIGMDISFDRPVSGAIIDEDFFVFSNFTYSPLFGSFEDDFVSYKGLLNHALPGRYYFVVFDPNEGTDDIVATSTWAAMTPAPITKGSPLTNQSPNVYNSMPYSYDAGPGADPWQAFTASGSGTGEITAQFYVVGNAYGRLDPLLNASGDPPCDDPFFGQICEDAPAPAFTQTYAETGTTHGRILIDDPSNFLITFHTATTTGAPTFDLEFAAREFTDLGTVMLGTPVGAIDQPLDTTTSVQRYLVRTGAENRLSITADPDPTLSLTVTQLAADEAPLDSASAGLGSAAELHAVPASSGWLAFEVTTALAALDTQFDLSVDVIVPPYTQSAGTTTFFSACIGGSTVDMSDNDDGQSLSTISAPPGFELFGTPVSDFYVVSNGFLSFDTGLDCNGTCFSNGDIPDAAGPNAMIAPYWDDLVLTRVCKKTSGTRLIIQWQGTTHDTSRLVHFQAILDGSTSTIEFVYGPTHNADGTGATIGLENEEGTEASKLGYDTTNSATNTLFTPN